MAQKQSLGFAGPRSPSLIPSAMAAVGSDGWLLPSIRTLPGYEGRRRITAGLLQFGQSQPARHADDSARFDLKGDRAGCATSARSATSSSTLPGVMRFVLIEIDDLPADHHAYDIGGRDAAQGFRADPRAVLNTVPVCQLPYFLPCGARCRPSGSS